MDYSEDTLKIPGPNRPRTTAKEGFWSLALLVGSATAIPAIAVAWVAAIRFIW